MGNDVFANGREVSCKAADGKAIAAFPDVCFTPPENPATPPGVPIPYPNTGMAKDTTAGSKNVKISGKEVTLKNKSYFKKSTGDEAGCAAKKGVLTSVNRGKVYFNSWSMDVKFEGENVVRHLDMTTHNHASQTGQTPPWPFMDTMEVSQDPCAKDKDKERSACAGKTEEEACTNPPCQAARKCKLVPYGGKSQNCCPGQTGHHMIEGHWVRGTGIPGGTTAEHNAAPTVCCEGGRTNREHGCLHGIQGVYEDSFLRGVNRTKKWTYGAGKKASIRAHKATFGDICSESCIEAQLDNFYGDDNSRELSQSPKRQSIANREGFEAYVDLVFGGLGL